MSKQSIVMIQPRSEDAAAYDAAWRRARQLCYQLPPLIVEAFKPVIISIYFQGLVDGYGTAERLAADLKGESQ